MPDLTRITSADPRYEDLAVRGDNARFTPRPEAFILVKSTEEVARAVEEAVRDGKRIAVRSGGHCYEDFVADPAVQVVIDMSEMNRVRFDDDRRAFVVEPGARLLEMYRALYLGWGVTVPGGASSLVGAGGHIVGGGYGPLSRRFGTCADHLHAVEVVTVDRAGRARVVVASSDPDNPHHDLWWAHTGAGGGNFGIITRYWLRSPGATGDEPGALLPRPPASILATSSVFPRDGLSKEAFRTLVGNHGRWHERNSDPDSPYAALFSGLVLFAVQPQDDPGIGAILFTHIDDTLPDAEALVGRYLAEITDGVEAMRFDGPFERRPWLSSVVKLAEAQDGESGRRHKMKSAYLRRGYTDEQIDRIHDHLTGSGHAFETATVSLQSYGCAVNATPSEATAVAQRGSVLRALYLTSWSDPATDEVNLEWTRSLYRDVYAATGGVPVPDERNEGCYINFPDVDVADRRWNTSGVPWQYLYFQDGHERLQEIKKRWDPRSVFHHALSVG